MREVCQNDEFSLTGRQIMAKFKVWLRPNGRDCKIRVDGPENVALLRESLKAKGVSSTDAIQLSGSRHCILHATCPASVTEEGLQLYVAGIPGVELMLDPA